ncbi:MAG: metallophosphoesterase, partial [Verrucomicrobia bacterium]
MTYYFRRTFTVDDPARVNSLTLSLLRDDGAIVYLNGQEAYRVSMPTGAVNFRTLATTAVEY